MYLYFFSFTHMEDNVVLPGNTALNTNIKVTDLDEPEDVMLWLKNVEKHIENVGRFRNVVISKFELLHES